MKARLSGKIKLTLFAIRESYIVLLPYFILTSIETIFFKGTSYFFPLLDVENTLNATDILLDIFPVLSVASISYHIAKVFEVEKAVSVVLSLTLYIFLISLSQGFQMHAIHLSASATFFSLLVPIVTTLVFSKLLSIKNIALHHYHALGDNLARIYQSSLAFILCFSLCLLLFIGLDKLLFSLYVFWDQLNFDLPVIVLLVIRSLVCHLIFFIGLHGDNTYDLVFRSDILQNAIFPNLTSKSFVDLFNGFGGAGNSLALAVAIFWVNKDKHSQAVTKIALPFLTFNISEILVYGLPVVFNRKLFYPFVFTPIINIMVAFAVLQLGIISFEPVEVPWTTPFLVSGYIATNGNWLAVLLQAVLLVLDVYIYVIFVRGYLDTQCTASLVNSLENRLGLANRIQVRERINFQQAQSYIVNSHIETHKIINLIVENELLIFYQPKVSMVDMSCQHYEALLRLKMKDGKVIGPFFLEQIENAGLAPSIDLWVCEQVASDLRHWQVDGHRPKISINLHPDTLRDGYIIKQIITLLKNYSVEFEIIERSFVLGEEVDSNIQLLRSHGFTMAIDDFGSGYSSLDSLHHRQVDVIKLDKSLIDIVDNEKGLKIYLRVVQLCKDLDFTIVAEGVETEAQMRVVKQAEVDYVQGWFFAPALPLDQAKIYQPNQTSKIFCLQ